MSRERRVRGSQRDGSLGWNRPILTVGLIALAIGTLSSGCAATLDAYVDARDDWSRSKIAWNGFVANATVHATLKAPAFREAYVKEYGRLFALTERQTARLRAAELEEAKTGYVIVVAFHTNELHWNTLHPRDGVWAVKLENAANNYVNASKVVRLDPMNPTWSKLYPYLGDQFSFWELTFPLKTAEGKALAATGELLELVVAGAPAQVRLKWKAP